MGGPGHVDGTVLAVTDNFYKAPFVINDLEYCSSENYFQASKATTFQAHQKIRNSGQGMGSWHEGNATVLRKDWEQVKVRVMYEGNKQKFLQNEEMKKKLIQTKGRINFGNSFWDQWNGLILERVRAELRQNGEVDTKKISQVEQKMKQYQEQQRKKY